MASLIQGSRYGVGKLGSTHWSTGVYRYSTFAGGFPVRSTMIWRVYTNKDTYERSRTKLAASSRSHSKVTQYWTPAGMYSQPHIYPHIHPPTVHPTFWPGNAPACSYRYSPSISRLLSQFIMAAHSNGRAIIFRSCGYLLLLLLAYSQPSEIACLAYTSTCGLSANLECRYESAAHGSLKIGNGKNRHLRTIAQLCRAVSSQITHVSTIGKRYLNSNISPHSAWSESERSRWPKSPCQFGQNRLNRGRDMAIFRFSKMAAVRHPGFVMCVFGPHTKGIWWSLSLCKIWLESMQ